MVSYQDVGSAADWLTEAFGFKETGERFTDNEGRVTHTQLELDGTEVMLGWPGPDYEDPARHAESCDRAWKWLDGPWVVGGVLVYVDDVDAHCERARSAGAQILRGPEDVPVGRLHAAADPWGHRWMFMQRAG
jgi:PhnB protein